MRQIIAIGGGGFSDERSPGLDTYILEQSHVPSPRILFIGTASGDSDNYLVRFYRTFSSLPCKPSHLPFFRKVPKLESFLREHDIIFVGGGNTKTMLAVWREWELPKLLQEALDAGILLSGISAGAMCWFEAGVTDASAAGLAPIQCLGFAPGSCCPHYAADAARRPRFHELIANAELPAGIGIDDDVAVHVIEGALQRVVVGLRDRDAHRVERGPNGDVIETPLQVEHIDVSAQNNLTPSS